MFTFFHRVSFFLVFLPLLITTVVVFILTPTSAKELAGDPYSVYGICAFLGCVVLPTVILLMVKADDLLVGGETVVPYFSWMMLTMPTWTVVILSALGALFF